MKFKIKGSTGALGIASVLALSPALIAEAQTNSSLSAVANPQTASTDTRFGLFNSLDHRSSYGTGVFPEPFLVDDSDLEVNEARLDWVHTQAKRVNNDEVTAEIEKGFGQLTLEAEFHYERESDAGDVTDGIGNIDLGGRYPSSNQPNTSLAENEFIDNTFGAAVELGIPVHSVRQQEH